MQRKERRSRKCRREKAERRHFNDPDYDGHERRSGMGRRSRSDRRVLEE